MTNTHAKFSPKLLQDFLSLVSDEVGEKNLPVVLNKSNLPAEWATKGSFENFDAQESAEAYAGLQKAIRAYYGRGARGILQRIGSKFWESLLKNASFKEKTQAKLLRNLPITTRRKSTLNMLTRLLDTTPEEMRVHSLDLNLILVDKISPTTYNQHDDEAICHITHGLIREAIYWATSQDAQIEETGCRAKGDENCEFKIIFGER